MQRINRAAPALGVAAYQTYRIASPPSTHTRPATCAEADCDARRHGWRTVVDERTDLGMSQAAYVRHECVADSLAASPAGRGRRRYIESRSPEGLTVFTFAAGQQCFAQHRVSLERPELYIVRGGDWRQNLGLVRRHTQAEHWVEDFATNQDRIKALRQRG